MKKPPLSDDDLLAIKKRYETAHRTRMPVATNAALNDAPALIAEIEHLRAGIERLLTETECGGTRDYLRRRLRSLLDGDDHSIDAESLTEAFKLSDCTCSEVQWNPYCKRHEAPRRSNGD